MPELPEVETMVRGIREHVAGRRIVSVTACPCSCRPISITPGLKEIDVRLRGVPVAEVTRLAKRVVMLMKTGDRVVVEPRMTGMMLLTDPPDEEHLRVRWRLSGRNPIDSVWFWDRRGLGTVTLYNESEYAERFSRDRLGPDALQITDGDWKELASRTARPIKVALLDQKLVAGIGNLYASEILHLAGISPMLPASRITAAQRRRLHDATQTVLRTAIRYEGSTLSDGTYRNALNQTGQYQNEHRVYDKAGEVCPKCERGRIRRCVQAQRSTFYCPVCQRTPRRA